LGTQNISGSSSSPQSQGGHSQDSHSSPGGQGAQSQAGQAQVVILLSDSTHKKSSAQSASSWHSCSTGKQMDARV
jgi:hypothetical protein